MMLWLAIAVLALMTVSVLAWAIMRQHPDGQAATLDLSMFEDQLAAAEDDDARTEIGRRILKAKRQHVATQATTLSSGARNMWLGAVFVLIVGLASGLYALMGKPDLPWQPRGLQSQEDITAGASIEELVPYMASVMRQQPDDVRGWALLASTAGNIGRHDIAATALANLNRLQPGDPRLMVSWAESQIAVERGLVTPAARDILRQVVDLDPIAPAAQYYLGLYDQQQGNPDAARDRWQALMDASPEDAPWVPRLRQALQGMPTSD